MTDLAAVLWDLDGTIVDTEPMWMAAEHELAAAHGVAWTEADGLQLVGNPLPKAAEYIRERIGLTWSIEEIVDHLVAQVVAALQGDVPWRPGASELIADLHAAGVPQALVTMSYAPIADVLVDTLGFDAVVTGDLVTHGKPHPEPYARAAALLGVDPADCVAIEDSPVGAASANAAGCTVLAVPHVVAIPPAARRVFRDSLAGATAAELRELRAAHV
ncbi:MAG: HAD family hydrolase [Aeromicrobium erythreum]